MTAVSLHIAGPTYIERLGLRIAATLTERVRARMVRRAERRALELERIRERQAHPAAQTDADRALLLLRSFPR